MKEKVNLKKIALMGITGGILMSQAHAAQQDSWNQNYTAADTASMQTSNKTMTEAELMSQLNSEGRATYQGLDSEGKALALKLANQSCKGKNDCKGLNACKTKDNSCAGMGSCKGKSPAPFADKNDAIKVAAKRMAEKRAKMNNR